MRWVPILFFLLFSAAAYAQQATSGITLGLSSSSSSGRNRIPDDFVEPCQFSRELKEKVPPDVFKGCTQLYDQKIPSAVLIWREDAFKGWAQLDLDHQGKKVELSPVDAPAQKHFPKNISSENVTDAAADSPKNISSENVTDAAADSRTRRMKTVDLYTDG